MESTVALSVAKCLLDEELGKKMDEVVVEAIHMITDKNPRIFSRKLAEFARYCIEAGINEAMNIQEQEKE